MSLPARSARALAARSGGALSPSAPRAGRPVSLRLQARAQLAGEWPSHSRPACQALRLPGGSSLQFRQLGGARHSSGSFSCPAAAAGGGPPSDGGAGKPPVGPGGDSSGAGDEPEDDDDDFLGLQEAEQIAASEKVQLPEDFLEAAKGGGLRRSALLAFIALQRGWLTRLICRLSPWLRDRLLFDPRFLFIVLSELVIDTACATVAEVRKRGDDFWQEFEFYLSDLVVGLVLDVVLVGLMATPAVIGRRKAQKAGGLKQLLARTPKAVFEPNQRGAAPYTLGQRLFCLVVKFGEYSLAGISCGIIGQALANVLMALKRNIVGEQEDDVAMPPILLTGLTWGAFMGGSSNIRYQTVFALERLVDKTIAKPFPRAPYAISFGLRLANNVIGGENFIDHARWTGIQPSSDGEGRAAAA